MSHFPTPTYHPDQVAVSKVLGLTLLSSPLPSPPRPAFDPSFRRYRTIQKDNAAFVRRVGGVAGCAACLRAVGFVDGGAANTVRARKCASGSLERRVSQSTAPRANLIVVRCNDGGSGRSRCRPTRGRR